MKCTICGKQFETYPEVKACYDSHPTTEAQVEAETPTLDALKGLLKQRSEPIKRIQPKQIAESETAEETLVRELIQIAKDNDRCGIGRITLAEARQHLKDKSLKLDDLAQLFHTYAPTLQIEPRPGNLIQIYFKTKVATTPIHIIDKHEETIKRLANAKFTGL